MNAHRSFVVILLVAECTMVHAGGAQQVLAFPSASLHANVAHRGRMQSDLMVQTLAIANSTRDTVRIDSLIATVHAVNGTSVRQQWDLAAVERLSAELAALRDSPAAPFAELTFPRKALGAASEIVATRVLRPGAALVLPALLVSTGGSPTDVLVEWFSSTVRGRSSAGSTVLQVSKRVTPSLYQFPLKGPWYASALPAPSSHHRWNPQTEFAVDLWRVDSAGSAFRGEGRVATDYPGFGATVHAAAAGVVVAAIGDVGQDWARRLRAPQESAEAYGRRIQGVVAAALRVDLHRGLIGNHVIIAHPNGEHSVYGHLRAGSVRARVGARVSAGELIAEVGDTGDSHLPHLHFQISDGPDPLLARSIPFTFSNARSHGLDPGTFLSSRE